MTNIMSVDYAQLDLLKIKHVLYLSAKPFEEINQKYNAVWIEVNEQEKPIIDFDYISI
jgi:hypothetical protein